MACIYTFNGNKFTKADLISQVLPILRREQMEANTYFTQKSIVPTIDLIILENSDFLNDEINKLEENGEITKKDCK